MKRFIQNVGIVVFLAVLVATVPFVLFAGGQPESTAQEPTVSEYIMGSTKNVESVVNPEEMETAVFAGGCFWGVEAVFEILDGVVDVRSGYSGGESDTAWYNLVASGRTSHAESVEIVFDPSTISYDVLLDVFFTVAHDPTQLNYQGPDHGPQYRSAIFFASEEQETIAKEFISNLEDSGAYVNPIVTEVAQLDEFYPAEDYHQDFLIRNPQNPYIVYWDIPKLEHLQEAYPDLLARQ